MHCRAPELCPAVNQCLGNGQRSCRCRLPLASCRLPPAACRYKGYMFVRCLMVEVLKSHHFEGCLQPRIKRHLPVRALLCRRVHLSGCLHEGTWCSRACLLAPDSWPALLLLSPLQVSWLGAWVMLLGFRDYQSEKHLLLGLQCLRPEEREMMEVAALWARVAAAAEVRPVLCTAGSQRWGCWHWHAGCCLPSTPVQACCLFISPPACRNRPESS